MNLSSSLVQSISLSEEEAESKSEISEESARQNDAGVYNENKAIMKILKSLIYTSTDVIQQIICQIHFIEQERNP